MSTMPAIGPSISFDRPNMLRVTIIGNVSMTTITGGATIGTAIVMMSIELVFRPSN
jgi:hypothetical protein